MESKKTKVDSSMLSEIKNLIDDKEYTVKEKLLDFLNFNNISENKKRKIIIKEILDNNLFLEMVILKKAMLEIKEWQNSRTSKNIISKISDISKSENYNDFITFTKDDNKEYYIIGDLHDDMKSFDQILEVINFKEKFDNINLIFLGDYIDRGKDRLILINKIIFLKYILPNNIYLLRGNHELYTIDKDNKYVSPMMNANIYSHHFDFLTFLINSEKETNKKFIIENGIDNELIKSYADFFNSMPIIALFNFSEIKICTMHGGLPRANLNSEDFYGSEEFDSFNKLLDEHTIDNVGIKQKTNILWSDPYDGYIEGFRNSSEVRFSYSKEQFIYFCKKYDIDMVLRAHESQENGYKSYFDDRLISVFSSGGKNKNDSSIINEHSYYEKVSPNILKIEKDRIISINIDFNLKTFPIIEEEFYYENIKKNRINHEKNIKSNFNRQVTIKELFKNIKPNSDIIQIVDLINPNNKRILTSKGVPIKCDFKELQQFFGIHKDTIFEIDQRNMIITNLSHTKIIIGENGAVLDKNQFVKVNNFIFLEIENGGKLAFII